MFALCMPGMLLLSPLGWLYYYPLLFVSALAAWRLSGRASQPRPIRLALALSLATSCLFRDFVASWEMNDPVASLLDAGVYHYALVGMFITAAFAVRSGAGPAPQAAQPSGA